MSAVPKLATYADLLALAEDERGELLNGVVVVQPAPRPRHSKVQGSMRRFIGGPFDDDEGFGGPGGWWTFLEVDVELSPHDVVRPDLAGWRRSRLPRPDARPIHVAPDWVCEIASPSTARYDRVEKRRLYAQHGIPHYWIVDPLARTLEALEAREGSWWEAGVYGDGDVARIGPFEAVELAVGRLFLPRELSPESED
jgi:Uma2 family endonuclease